MASLDGCSRGFICLLLAAVCLTTAKAAEQATKVKKAKPAGKAQPDLLEIPQVAKRPGDLFALYTVHKGILKLTAQLYPLEENDPDGSAGGATGRPVAQGRHHPDRQSRLDGAVSR